MSVMTQQAGEVEVGGNILTASLNPIPRQLERRESCSGVAVKEKLAVSSAAVVATEFVSQTE